MFTSEFYMRCKLMRKFSEKSLSHQFLLNSQTDLLTSYLANRKQCVVVDGVKSSMLEVKAGVPQGSRLGPLLFLIYINDIVNNIESEIKIFAADTTLLASGSHPNETTSQLTEIWLKYLLGLNSGKLRSMLVNLEI